MLSPSGPTVQSTLQFAVVRLFRSELSTKIYGVILGTSTIKWLCIHENCTSLGYYAASSGTLLQTFPENLSVPSSLTPEDGTDRLSRNFGKDCVICQQSTVFNCSLAEARNHTCFIKLSANLGTLFVF
jgi:hypothetical protein